MQTSLRFIAVIGLCILLSAALRSSAQQAAQAAGEQPKAAPRASSLPMFFREDWKLDLSVPNSNTNTQQEQEHTVGQGDVSNANLRVQLYGDKVGPVVVHQTGNDMTFVMSMLCTANCAITLADRNNYVDLTGLAKIRWRTRVGGFHMLRPILKLADGTWLVGDRATGFSTDWAESEMFLTDVRWRNLDIENVVEARDGKWVDNPNLSQVDEIGFTDLMRGTGHGNGGGSRVDWIEVYGKPVQRSASRSPAR